MPEGDGMKCCADKKIMERIFNAKPVKLIKEHGKVVWRNENGKL